MKKLFTLLIIFVLSYTDSYAQEGKTCWKNVNIYERVRIDCKDVGPPEPRPSWTIGWDMDSLVTNMEVKLINRINEHRVSLGLDPWVYSEELLNGITFQHNYYQATNNYVGHSENGKNMDQRCREIDWLGFKRIGENCASHHRFENRGVSFFFEQYMRSPKHKALIEDPNYVYYATSVMYNYSTNTFFNTLNVSYDF